MNSKFVYIGTIVAWQYVVNGGLGKKFETVSMGDAALFSKVRITAPTFALT